MTPYYADDCVAGRFVRSFDVDPASGCWEWRGYLSGGGYGRIRVGMSSMAVHRLAYEMWVGPIPEGLTIDHLCRNRRCLNPEHLEAVTLRVNILRGDGVGALAARRNHCKYGHEYTPENTRIEVAGNRRCMTCERAANLRSKQKNREAIRERGRRKYAEKRAL